jgi:hypothetical protein
VPDEIKALTLLHCTPDSFAVGWDPPCSNNVPTTHFSVYLRRQGDEEYLDVGDLPVTAVDEDGSFAYEITHLAPDSCYYVMVTAFNELGEGYRPKYGQLVLTMKETMYNPGSLYVWGNNESSELGIGEEIMA